MSVRVNEDIAVAVGATTAAAGTSRQPSGSISGSGNGCVIMDPYNSSSRMVAASAPSAAAAAPGSDGGGGTVGGSPSSPPILITRRLNIKIHGSMADFAQDGQGCATWRGLAGKHAAIWGLEDYYSMGGGDGSDGGGIARSAGSSSNTHTSVTHLLGSVVVKNLKLLEHKSSYGVGIGVNINCVPACEMTSFGEAFTYTVLPHGKSSVPLTLYEASDVSGEANTWRNQFPKYNSSNLETHGVLKTSDQSSYMFVHENHPVIGLLRANRDFVGCNIDEQHKVDNEWFKVQQATFATCCTCIRQKVLSKVQTKDLNNFALEISRIGTKDWIDMADGDEALASFVAPIGATDSQIQELERKHLEDFCEKRCSYHARLKITFEIQP